MSSLEDIKKQELELKRQKWNLEMSLSFNFFKDRSDTEEESIKKFLGSKDGVDLDRIMWAIEKQGKEDLRCIIDLYKTERLVMIPYEEAKNYVDKLEPFGFYIHLKSESTARCILCDEEEPLYTLSLLKYSETGYGSRNDYLIRWIQTKRLFIFKIFVDRKMIDEYLKNTQISLDSIDSVEKKLKFIKEKIRDDYSVNYSDGYRRKRLCIKCIENPDYKKIVDELELGFLKPEWLRIEKDNEEKV